MRSVGALLRERGLGFAMAAPRDTGAPSDARHWRASVAVNNFIAGKLLRDCQPTVLPPTLSMNEPDIPTTRSARPAPDRNSDAMPRTARQHPRRDSGTAMPVAAQQKDPPLTRPAPCHCCKPVSTLPPQ